MSDLAIDRDVFRGVQVLVTGHTGFKGAWLCAWLKAAGANVTGLALAPESDRPSLFADLRLEDQMQSIIGDIRDLSGVRRCVAEAAPEIIFHLAAQALVRRSYADPIGTFATNVLGTAHVLEAARQQPSVRAIVCVTSDKCYQDREWVWGHREIDALGGNDPYSASKAGAEIIAQCYLASLLPQEGRIRLATARGGNVIGGGDWSEDRLVPDLARAGLTGNPLVLRNPRAVRPWQHVLELVRGYCVLGARLLNGDRAAEGAWNFGPAYRNEVTVDEVVGLFVKSWGTYNRFDIRHEPSPLREAPHLRLDISKAETQLGWHPRLNLEETIGLTVEWYRQYAKSRDAAVALTHDQLASYRTATGFA